MKLRVLWLILLSCLFSAGGYAKSIEKISFDLESIRLTKNTWGRGGVDLNILVIHQNSSGRTSKLHLDDETISASLYEEVLLNNYNGTTIPINGQSVVEVTVLILRENPNTELASLVLEAIGNLAKRTAIQNLNKLSQNNWISAVASGVLELGTSYAKNEIIEYLRENEIGRIVFEIEEGSNGWKHRSTEFNEDGSVEISYVTNFVGGNGQSISEKIISLIEDFTEPNHDMTNIVTVESFMFSDIPYTEEEIDMDNSNIKASLLLSEQKEYGKLLNFDNAVKYCEELSLGGYTDWRLPRISDLELVRDDYRDKFRDYWKTTMTFWSSDVGYIGNRHLTLNHRMNTIIPLAKDESTPCFVRCIRNK